MNRSKLFGKGTKSMLGDVVNYCVQVNGIGHEKTRLDQAGFIREYGLTFATFVEKV